MHRHITSSLLLPLSSSKAIDADVGDVAIDHISRRADTFAARIFAGVFSDFHSEPLSPRQRGLSLKSTMAGCLQFSKLQEK